MVSFELIVIINVKYKVKIAKNTKRNHKKDLLIMKSMKINNTDLMNAIKITFTIPLKSSNSFKNIGNSQVFCVNI